MSGLQGKTEGRGRKALSAVQGFWRDRIQDEVRGTVETIMAGTSKVSVFSAWINLAAVIIISVLGYLMTGALEDIKQLRTDVAAIKANRFTSSDGMEVWKQMSAMEARIPTEVPPKWFKEEVDDIAAAQKAIKTTLESQSRTLATLSAQMEMHMAAERKRAGSSGS